MEPVVLLHGLGRSKGSLRQLDRRLAAAGFTTLRLGYPSRDEVLADLVAGLEPQLPKEGAVSFVGHSLGGVLSKHLMRRLQEARRGRIVQLGAPNLGSALAERVGFLGPIMGPVMAELEPSEMPEAGVLDDSDLEIGAIAGTAAWKVYGAVTGIEGENDGKVSVASAWGDAPPERRIKLSVAHSTMMHNEDVIAAVISFLKTGAFPAP